MRSAERSILIVVILFNIVLLVGLGKHFSNMIQSSKPEVPFIWGDKVPELVGATSLSGERVDISHNAKTLSLMLFFNDSLFEEITSINDMWGDFLSFDNVQCIGIFCGSEKTIHKISMKCNFNFPVVIDNKNTIHKQYRVYPPPVRGTTMAFDKNLKLKLIVRHILKDEFMKDFVFRHASIGKSQFFSDQNRSGD